MDSEILDQLTNLEKNVDSESNQTQEKSQKEN